MIQNLCMFGLPFASRQNEMIEMALTFRFTGMEVDLDEMGRRAEAMGQDFATQFVNSAKIEVASFRLPVDFGADEAAYTAAKERLESLCTIAEAIEAKRCYAVIAPGSNQMAFQENFELHRTRIGEIADRLAKSNISLGLTFDATPSEKEKYEYQFVCKAEELLALVKAVTNNNVGLALDTWQWQLGDGAMDQLQELGADRIMDVRFADLPDNVDHASVSSQDRRAPYGDQSKFSVDVLKFLAAGGYEHTISVVAAFSDSNDRSRGFRSVEKIRNSLNGILVAAGLEDAVPKNESAEQESAAPAAAEKKSDSQDSEKQDGEKPEAQGENEKPAEPAATAEASS